MRKERKGKKRIITGRNKKTLNEGKNNKEKKDMWIGTDEITLE